MIRWVFMIRTIFRSQLFLQEMWVLPFSLQRKDLHDDPCDLSDKSITEPILLLGTASVVDRLSTYPGGGRTRQQLQFWCYRTMVSSGDFQSSDRVSTTRSITNFMCIDSLTVKQEPPKLLDLGSNPDQYAKFTSRLGCAGSKLYTSPTVRFRTQSIFLDVHCAAKLCVRW